jgi:RNA polymerase sigma-70 factor (ECF subfamily)
MAGELMPLASLVRRLADGDNLALSSLYDATSRAVYGLILRILGNPADAEEVTLDVYTQAWRQAARYDVLRGDPLTWLLTLAHSRAIDRLRSRAGSKRREQELDSVAEFPAPDADPETASATSQQAVLVRRALARLSPEQRQVIELAYFEGLTHVEIAERIRQPLGTAKSRIRLGLAKLREALSPLAEGVTA